jgi:hypothetical protein
VPLGALSVPNIPRAAIAIARRHSSTIGSHPIAPSRECAGSSSWSRRATVECDSASAEKKGQFVSEMDTCLMSGFRNRSVAKCER